MLQEEAISSPSVNAVRSSNTTEELEKLRARIEQQSELISLMKKRSDSLLRELDTLYANIAKQNEDKDDLESQLSMKQKQIEDQDKQICSLKGNCEELTSSNKCLSKEIELLKCQSEQRLQEKAIVMDENTILLGKLECLQAKVKLLSEENETIKKGFDLTSSVAKSDFNELREKYETTSSLNSHLQQQINKIESQLTDSIQNMQVVKKKHLVQINDLYQQLTAIELEVNKWKQKASDLERQLLVIQKNDTCKSVPCVKKSDNIEKENVTQIKEKMASLEKEFCAYKKHSMELLEHERQLNSKLRHLTL